MGSTYWICNNGTTLTMPNTSNSESNATLWYLDGGNYATNVNGTKYYLGISSNNSNVILTTNQSDAFKFNNGYFSIERAGRWPWQSNITYYMTTEKNYSGNSLIASENQSWQYQTKSYQAAEASLSISTDDSKSEILMTSQKLQKLQPIGRSQPTTQSVAQAAFQTKKHWIRCFRRLQCD